MKTLVVIFVALLLVGCGSQPAATKAETTTTAEVSCAKDIRPMLNLSCMPCHAGGKDAKGSYDLTSHAGIMGSGTDSVANVLPGNADSSTLYRRVSDTIPLRMPKGRPPLDAAQLSTIQKWINQGAKNN